MTAPTIAITIRCRYPGCAARENTPHSDPDRAATQARLNGWLDIEVDVPRDRRQWFCPSHAKWVRPRGRG